MRRPSTSPDRTQTTDNRKAYDFQTPPLTFITRVVKLIREVVVGIKILAADLVAWWQTDPSGICFAAGSAMHFGGAAAVDEQPNPTGGELELLGVLWEHGALSLSEVHDRLGRDLGYTTVQTRLNRLVEKGWATKSKTGKQPTHYAALVQPDAVRERQLDHFVERVAQGSVVPLVAHLVQGNSLTRDELTELKKLIRDAERRHEHRSGEMSDGEAKGGEAKGGGRSKSGNKAGGR